MEAEQKLPAAEAIAPGPSEEVRLELTLDEARVLQEVARRGMLASAGDGSPPAGNPHHAKAALAKLSDRVESAERIASIRTELERSGLDTSHLSAAELWALARRLGDLPAA